MDLWSQLTLGEFVEDRPALNRAWASFLDDHGVSRWLLLETPPDFYAQIADQLTDVFQHTCVVACRRQLGQYLKRQSFGCSKIYNLYIPKPKETENDPT